MSLITLIGPPVIVAKWAHTTPACAPIRLAYWAASLENVGMSVKAVDAVGNAPDQLSPADDERFLTKSKKSGEAAAR